MSAEPSQWNIEIEIPSQIARIYQDLVSDYGFTAEYHSVRRYVGTLVSCKELPVRRIEVEAWQKMQIDYGQGARCMEHTGKLRKTYIFRLVLSHSRKGYASQYRQSVAPSVLMSGE